MKPRKILLCLLAGAVTGLAPGLSAWAQQVGPHAASAKKVYVVRMSDKPVVANDGQVPGLPATRPAKGTKLDPGNADVQRYAAYLESRHDQVVASSGAKKIYSYKYAFNGFAAELTDAQVQKLRSAPGILAIEEDEARKMDTSSTPTFLGLDARGVGLWNRDAGGGKKGNNMIIGMVDSGIWPEHPSFGKLPRDANDSNGNGNFDFTPRGYSGKCVAGDQFKVSDCSDKLIGARWFNSGWGGDAGVKAHLPWEFLSARDYSGHGSHTASTAAGNENVLPVAPFSAFGKISGMAPYARIAVYKVCWETLDPNVGGCYTSDSVAAIDQAVADGVDVINFSISGSSTNFRDSVEIAFMFAADAGVFVAASAGNSGPTTGTVAHPGPWLTTVAAGTHSRDGKGSVTLGNGVTYNGGSFANALGSTRLINAASAAKSPAVASMAARCFGAADNAGVAVLDPAIVAGKIVVCDRGTTAKVAKSAAVKEAGGVGMVFVNVPGGATSVDADVHAVPTVHLPVENRDAVQAYAATAGATATIAQSTIVSTKAAPFTADFSSRGPLAAGNGDLLKPDLIAPGQSILAAVAPPNNGGELYGMYDGTSMSSPHVAGLALLLKNLHPDWSPMMVKSALMTTATDVLDGANTNPLVIFRQGAGHVKPNAAFDPGLVFDSGMVDWMGFLCGTQLPREFCDRDAIPVLDPSDFNGPSLAFGDLTAFQTVQRTLTNVGAKSSTYTATTTGLAGFSVVISPATFTVGKGRTQKVSITVTRTSAPLSSYAGGYITWSDGTHSVRMPVVVRPTALAAPAEVSGSYSVKFGFTGAFSATVRGLIKSQVLADSVTHADYTLIPVSVPAATTLARFSMYDEDVSAASDLDLYLFNADFSAQVAGSGGSTSREEISVRNLPAGNYWLLVDGYNVPAGTVTFKVHQWLLGSASAGNLTLEYPAAAVAGNAGEIKLTVGASVDAGKWLGSIVYGGAAGLPSPTIVRIDR